ncbi:lytic transglycosylase domain-containing protein [Glaciibacter superstes]|uniref:aggregation-promoting factor C-terminal-like domain-containing protein n=1 Tax=Glaciibacter superstes TaxID=501023 RepID=UPI0003B62174|nr:lytic transglycosylase domain-containing protein [Glaciibacter superstes]
MRNEPTSSSTPGSLSTDTGPTRIQRTHRRRGRRRFLAIGAVVAVGAMVGTGFVLQSAVTAQSESIAATQALTDSTGFQAEQLEGRSAVLAAHAEHSAKGAIAGANAVITSAQGKTDATVLSTTVASLNYFPLLAPERVFELVEVTATQAASVQAATAEVDRVATEQVAADAAAAQAAAAAAAAAEEAGDSASSSRPSAPSNPTEAQAIARDLMASLYGWGDDQFGCLVPLWQKESGWNVNAYNASSGATGIPQALPGSKMASAGDDWQTNPATQITWGLGYIAGRYGTPCDAWDHSESAGWY